MPAVRRRSASQAEALVANGVVVVAAAGNRGFQQYQLADNSTFEGYASSSITDPGNADGVITVGATHRSWPHTYGVSFFSSRGPTGDGRLKPDLLARVRKSKAAYPATAKTSDGRHQHGRSARQRRCSPADGSP